MRKTPTKAVVLMMASLVLAGCTGGDTQSVDATTDPQATGSDAPLEEEVDPGAQPTWTHGDWWEYRILIDPGFGEPLFDATEKVVVNRADESGYHVAAGGRDVAVIESEFDLFFVGDIGADLSSDFQGVSFKLFDWPLEAGKTWGASVAETDATGNFAAASITLSASAEESVGGFRIQGATDAGTIVEATYDPGAKWLTQFRLVNPDGTVAVSMALQDRGANYTGTFTEVEYEAVYERFVLFPLAPLAGADPAAVDRVDVDDSFDFLLRVSVILRLATQLDPAPPVPGGGASDVTFLRPSNQMDSNRMYGASDDDLSLWYVFEDDYETGTYQVTHAHAGSLLASFAMIHGYHETVTRFEAQDHANH